MANWQRTLDIAEIWKRSENEQATSLQVAEQIVSGLKALEPFNIEDIDNARDDLVQDFQDFVDTDEDDDDEFNALMGDLYDWGDTPIGRPTFNGKKVCFVKTF